MPTAFQLVETSFPQPDNKNTDQKIDGIYDYLFILLEQLRYTLFNLDGSNVNQSALSDFIQNISDPIYAKIKDTDENVNELSITAQGLAGRISDAEGNITQLGATAEGLSARVSDAEGNISSLTQTAEGLQVAVSGKLDGEQAQTLIDQMIGGITLAATSGSEGTVLSLTKDGAVISSTGSIDFHVKAVNIDGALVVGQLPDGVAMTDNIPTNISQLFNDSGFQNAAGVQSILDGGGYQNATGVVSIVNGTVTADYIYALGVEASVIRGNSVGLKDGNGNTVGAMQLSYTSTGMGIALLTNQGGIQMQPAGNVFLASGGGAFITLSNVVSLGGAPLVLSSKMYGNTLPSNPVQGTLYFLRKNT